MAEAERKSEYVKVETYVRLDEARIMDDTGGVLPIVTDLPYEGLRYRGFAERSDVAELIFPLDFWGLSATL